MLSDLPDGVLAWLREHRACSSLDSLPSSDALARLELFEVLEDHSVGWPVALLESLECAEDLAWYLGRRRRRC
jgi:hypothetical protein